MVKLSNSLNIQKREEEREQKLILIQILLATFSLRVFIVIKIYSDHRIRYLTLIH